LTTLILLFTARQASKAWTIQTGQTAPTAEAGRVTVTGEAIPTPTPYDNWREMRQHIMPEVSGTQITVTKKATVIKLDQQPPIENNDLQEEFIKAPGLLITEQHTPGQFNFSYRGLGNPQESEFITLLKDGVPLMSDWIGFPTLYYLPFPQSVSEIQFIRGGSSLLYGPEPAPAINFVTKRPLPYSTGDFYTENLGGPYGLYTTYDVIEEAAGPLEFRLDGGYSHADGQRDHSAYDIWQADLYVGYRPDEHQLLALEFHASRFDGDDPGRLSITQFEENPNQSTTPFNKDWVDRYSAILRYGAISARAGCFKVKRGTHIRRSTPLGCRFLSIKISTTVAPICVSGKIGVTTPYSRVARSLSAVWCTMAMDPTINVSPRPIVIATTTLD